MSVFKRYKVTLQIRDKILGGIPVGFEREENFLVREQVRNPDVKEKVKIEPYSTFLRNSNNKICIEEKNIKGLLKECVQTLYGRTRQSTLTQKVVTRAVFVEPQVIEIADKVDGTLTRPVHAMTMQGPRTTIKQADFVSKPRITFTLKVAAPEMNKETLRQLLELGQEIGLGADRSQGYGKYDLIEIEEVE